MLNESKKNRSEVPAVETAIKILEYLSRYKHRLSTLSEISRDLSINKSTCYRILKVLNEYRFVSYDEDSKHYSLGSYLIVLGARAAEFIDYLKTARPHLKWLAEQTGQTSVLVEPISGNRLMYVAKEEPNRPVRVTVSIGQYFPITSASFGKCFLAFLDEKEAEEIIRKVGIKQFTNRTITNIEQFMEHLKQIRAKGYAESYEEHTPGICGVSAPIFDLYGNVNMVIACIGLAAQMNPEVMPFYAEKVKEAARRITDAFSGKEPYAPAGQDALIREALS
ncbi:IclR family transcriptional regulator [Desulfofundulus salinus]|nr:IclR family transcriptional regulator [Desulfofundulus salinum]